METIREEIFGKTRLRLVRGPQGLTGIVLPEGGGVACRISGTDPDMLWRELKDAAAQGAAGFFGYGGARNRFLRMFPEGFNAEQYISKERNWKLDARQKLEAAVPLAEAARFSGDPEAAVMPAFLATTLLSSFEKPRVRDCLKGKHGPAFVRGAAQFAMGEIAKGLNEMRQALKPHDVAHWTAVTYLPFLWAPEQHMFLKPEALKDFATRVGHPFVHEYDSELDVRVYESLLDMTRRVRSEIADLGPRDNIDVQSFMWVAGSYTDGDEAELSQQRAG